MAIYSSTGETYEDPLSHALGMPLSPNIEDDQNNLEAGSWRRPVSPEGMLPFVPFKDMMDDIQLQDRKRREMDKPSSPNMDFVPADQGGAFDSPGGFRWNLRVDSPIIDTPNQQVAEARDLRGLDSYDPKDLEGTIKGEGVQVDKNTESFKKLMNSPPDWLEIIDQPDGSVILRRKEDLVSSLAGKRFAEASLGIASDASPELPESQGPTQDSAAFIERGRGALDRLFGLYGPRYELWPEKAIKELASSLRSITIGERDIMSEQGAGEVFKDAATLATGGVSAALGRTGSSLGIFGGRGAKGANDQALREAMIQDIKGIPKSETWRETGWYKGPDEKWRFELPSNEAKLAEGSFVSIEKALPEEASWTSVGTGPNIDRIVINKFNGKLDEILDFPALYKAYPELKDMKVKFDSSLGSDVRGSYSPDTNTISLNHTNLGMHDPDTIKSVLLHEIQHKVQNIEGFAKGTNDSYIGEVAREGLNKKISEVYDNILEGWWRSKGLNTEEARDAAILQGKITEKDFKELDKLANSNKEYKQLSDLRRDLNKHFDDLSYYLYKATPGEIEARLVQARRLWTNESRRREAPHITERKMLDIEDIKKPISIPTDIP
jgi:conjugative element/phage-associated large polyvalent protein